MVQDPSSLRTEHTISTASGQWVIRKMKYACPSKASEVYRPVWCSISAHTDHLVATLHHLPNCNFNLVWSDSSSAELWLLVDTHHDTRIGAEVSAIILTFMHAKLTHWEMFAHSAKYIASSIRREIPHLFGWHQIELGLRSRVIPNEATQVERFPALF